MEEPKIKSPEEITPKEQSLIDLKNALSQTSGSLAEGNLAIVLKENSQFTYHFFPQLKEALMGNDPLTYRDRAIAETLASVFEFAIVGTMQQCDLFSNATYSKRLKEAEVALEKVRVIFGLEKNL
jgi:hypothetical protein